MACFLEQCCECNGGGKYEGNFISDRFLPRIFRMDASRETILCISQLYLTKNKLAYSGNPDYIPS